MVNKKRACSEKDRPGVTGICISPSLSLHVNTSNLAFFPLSRQQDENRIKDRMIPNSKCIAFLPFRSVPFYRSSVPFLIFYRFSTYHPIFILSVRSFRSKFKGFRSFPTVRCEGISQEQAKISSLGAFVRPISHLA